MSVGMYHIFVCMYVSIFLPIYGAGAAAKRGEQTEGGRGEMGGEEDMERGKGKGRGGERIEGALGE